MKAQYSLDEWVELFAYMRIRGPLGPPRWDYNTAHLSPYGSFDAPWNKEPIEDDEADDS